MVHYYDHNKFNWYVELKCMIDVDKAGRVVLCDIVNSELQFAIWIVIVCRKIFVVVLVVENFSVYFV